MNKEMNITPETVEEFKQWLSYVRIKVGYKKVDLIRKQATEQEKKQEMINSHVGAKFEEIKHSYQESWEFHFEWSELIEALNQLTKLQQEVLWRIYVLGESQKEVAIKLDISTPAVSKVKKRAISKLKEILKNT